MYSVLFTNKNDNEMIIEKNYFTQIDTRSNHSDTMVRTRL